MCTYNGSAYLGEQLRSIAFQTLPPDEVVVCDDRSSDDSVAVVEAWAETVPFEVKIVRNPVQLGSTKNFGQAIEMCTGDVIVLADQDDEWLPAKLRRLANAFDADPAIGAVFTDAEVVDQNLQPLGYTMFEALRFDARKRGMIAQDRAFDLVLNEPFVTGATLAFRAGLKDHILPIPQFSEHVIHDRWIAIVVAAVSRLAVLNEPLIRYRQHPKQQIGATIVETRPADRMKSFQENNPDSYKKRLEFFTVLRERLLADRSFPARAGFLNALSARITHYEARSAMPRGRVRRVPIIARELVSRRYAKYSAGAPSALKDLFWNP